MRVLGVVLCVALLLPGCASPPGSDPQELTLAAHLIWTRPYPGLLVEVDHAPGRAPQEASLRMLEEVLRDVTDKREVRVLPPQPAPDEPRFRDAERNWTTSELLDLHRELFSSSSASRRGADGWAFLHVVFLNGRAGEESEFAGLQLSNVVFVFPDTLRRAPAGSPLPPMDAPGYARVEQTVLLHELGHALGLVGGDVPMVHERLSKHGRHHSRYESSPMYPWVTPHLALLAETADETLMPVRFDAYDLEDLARFRETGRARGCPADPARCH